MRPITITAGPLASSSANKIALSQTPTGAGALTLNGAAVVGGVALLDNARQVLFTFAADETGHNFVITGTNWASDVISETIAGTAAGTVASVLSYKTVTSVTISAAATGAIQVGTNGVGASPWARMDDWALPKLTIQCDATGTVNYTVQFSNDDPNSPWSPVTPSAMTWVNTPDLNMVGQTASTQGSLDFAPAWMRVLLNSGSGSVAATVTQAGSVTY